MKRIWCWLFHRFHWESAYWGLSYICPKCGQEWKKD